MPISVRRGVEVPPPAAVQQFLPQIVAVLRTALLLSQVGLEVEITSWWRSPTRNAAAGGAEASQHLVGAAIDLVEPRLSRAQFLPVVQWAASKFGAVVPVTGSATSGRSVHVQAMPAGQLARFFRTNPDFLGQLGGGIRV